MAEDLLTEHELKAMDLTRELTNLVMIYIVDNGGTYHKDVGEFVLHIHAIQNMIQAQAAARAYPGKFRLLGQSFLNTPPL